MNTRLEEEKRREEKSSLEMRRASIQAV